MNKILTINLGGYPYTIDEDAYELLNRYLDSIRRHFKANQSYQEIITDIETRLAEIFSEKMGTRTIVSLQDVEGAIGIMGKPEDFGAEPMDNSSTNSGTGAAFNQFRNEYRTGKRLFRDSDDKVFGGVCSGISAYFGIQDPLWVRIGFAVAFFSFGVGFLLYFILWIIVPEAQTAADRLAMRGEPINVENIAKVVEEEFNNISNNINSTQHSYSTSGGAKGAVADSFSFIGQVFYRIVEVIKTIAKPIVFFFGVIAFIVLAAFWIAFTVVAKEGYNISHYAFGNNSFFTNLGFINIFFLLGLALLGIGLLIARIFFKIKISKYWGLGIAGFWLLNGISFGLIGAKVGSEFNRESRVTEDVFTVSLPTDTMVIKINEDNRFSDIHSQFGPFKFDREKLLNGHVNLDVKESTTGEYRLVKEIKAYGSSREEAEQLAREVNYIPKLDGNVLLLPEFFTMENTKYRAQQVRMTLYVPSEKYIKLTEGTSEIVNFEYNDRHYRHWDRDGHTWQMKNGEMSSPEILGKSNFSKPFNFDGFTKIDIDGRAKITIKYGEKYDIQFKGDEDAVKSFEVDKTGNLLRINQNEKDDFGDEKVQITITTPKLDVLTINEDAQLVSVLGFVQDEMKIDASGDFKVEADVEVKKLTVTGDKNAQIVLKGKGQNLEAILDDNAELNARQFEVKTATVSMRNGSEAEIYATEKVVNRREEGELRVEGGATVEGKKD